MKSYFADIDYIEAVCKNCNHGIWFEGNNWYHACNLGCTCREASPR